MYFDITDDQKLLQEAFSALLADKCPPGAVRKVWEGDIPRIESLWSAMAEMGALGTMAAENAVGKDLGGAGFSEIEFTLLMEVAGYHGLPEPFLEHGGIGVPALFDAFRAKPEEGVIERYLKRAIAGEITISAGYSISQYVAYGSFADLFLLISEGELYLVPARATELHPQLSLEAPKNPVRVEWEPRPEFLLGDKKDVELAFLRGALATSGECLGIAKKLLDTTVKYVSEREQFGRPVGSQQAVKHHLADVAIALEHARPSVYAAAWALANKTPNHARDVSAAKVLASEAADLSAKKALQSCGAIGYTVENDLNFWLKKAWVASASWGSADHHLDRVSAAIAKTVNVDPTNVTIST